MGVYGGEEAAVSGDLKVGSAMRDVIRLTGSLTLVVQAAMAQDVYRCDMDGHVHFQESPCPQDAQTVKALHYAPPKANALIGCYRLEGKENEVWRVSSGGKTGYRLTAEGAGGSTTELPLKVATNEELAMLSQAFAEDFKYGLSVVWPKDTPNTKPVGVYRAEGRDGRERVLGYFFFDGGEMKAVGCP